MSFFFVFGLNSCKYECEGFPESEVKWIPYERGTELDYFSRFSEISFYVISSDRTRASEYRGIGVDENCEWEGRYNTDLVSGFRITEEKVSESEGYSTSFSELDEFNYNLQPYFTNGDVIVSSLGDTTINNTKYINAYLIEKLVFTSNTSVSWFIKAENVGVVQFFDVKSNLLWTVK